MKTSPNSVVSKVFPNGVVIALNGREHFVRRSDLVGYSDKERTTALNDLKIGSRIEASRFGEPYRCPDGVVRPLASVWEAQRRNREANRDLLLAAAKVWSGGKTKVTEVHVDRGFIIVEFEVAEVTFGCNTHSCVKVTGKLHVRHFVGGDANLEANNRKLNGIKVGEEVFARLKSAHKHRLHAAVELVETVAH
jgi:hypothetical protein